MVQMGEFEEKDHMTLQSVPNWKCFGVHSSMGYIQPSVASINCSREGVWESPVPAAVQVP